MDDSKRISNISRNLQKDKVSKLHMRLKTHYYIGVHSDDNITYYANGNKVSLKPKNYYIPGGTSLTEYLDYQYVVEKTKKDLNIFLELVFENNSRIINIMNKFKSESLLGDVK